MKYLKLNLCMYVCMNIYIGTDVEVKIYRNLCSIMILGKNRGLESLLQLGILIGQALELRSVRRSGAQRHRLARGIYSHGAPNLPTS